MEISKTKQTKGKESFRKIPPKVHRRILEFLNSAASPRDLIGLACQFIVIDRIPDGEYTFEATTNATSVRAAKEKTGKIIFEEDNYDDNTVTVSLRIDGNRVRQI
jgi:hypothetical protein